TTPPETTIDSGPSGTVSSGSAMLVFSASEPGTSFGCSLDGADFGPCSSPQSYSGLADGSHTFAVRATDLAGNVDATPASRSWRIDTAAPDTTITSGPTGTTASGSASFAFSASEAGSSYECALDGSAFASCSSPKSYSGLANGSHTFQVRATDAAGNVDPTPAGSTWIVQGATTPTLYAQVGPTATISLKYASGSRVRRLPAGAYTIVVRDLST